MGRCRDSRLWCDDDGGAPAALADVADDGVLIQAQEAGGDQGGDNDDQVGDDDGDGNGGDDKDKDKPRPADPRERLRPGDHGVPTRTGDNTAAWAAAGGVVLISVVGGTYVLRRRQA